EEGRLGQPGLELADGRTVFTATVDGARHPWVLEHRLLDRTLLPGTALLTLVQQAAAAVGASSVDELELGAPLLLSGARPTSVQVTVEAADARGGRGVTVHSRGRGQEGWIRHADGLLGSPSSVPDGRTAWNRPPFEDRVADFDPEEGYAELGRRGYQHGELFRGLREVWRQEGSLLARVALPEGAGTSPEGARSALLDSALHAVLLFGAEREGTTAVPHVWRGVRILGEETGPESSVGGGAPTELFVSLELLGSGGYRLSARDGAGRTVLEVDELVLRAVGAEDLPTSPDEEPGLYRWEPLQGALAQAAIPAGTATLDALESTAPIPAVVYAELPASVVYADQDPVPTAAYRGLSSALETVRTWLEDERTAHSRLALVTWRSVVTTADDRLSGLAAAPVWGLLRSIQREHPGRLVLVDSDGSEESHRVLAAAVESGEPQSALREGRVLVPRLAEAAQGAVFVPPAASWSLHPGAVGGSGAVVPDSAPGASEPLGPSQVRVAVRAVGLDQEDAAVPGSGGAGRAWYAGAGLVLE
ncbi:MAG: polyketide synthase dehydratase domain-containing protein, partial [Nocardiopsis sp. BM-2018]